MYRRSDLGTTWVFIILTLLTGCDDQTPDGMTIDDPLLVKQGAEIYHNYCAQCHGVELEGHPDWQRPMEDGRLHPPPHDETGHTWHHGDQLLFQIVKNGGQSIAPPGFTSGMPSYADDLTDREIWAVLSFIKSTWSLEYQQRQEARNH